MTDDLQLLAEDKDTSRSCVFAWPDRPIDSLPPDIPVGTPPDKYPYNPIDDWPFNHPIPIVLPPGVPSGSIPLGTEFTRVVGEASHTFVGVGPVGVAFVSGTVTNLGAMSADGFYGNAATLSDFIVRIVTSNLNKTRDFIVDLVKLKAAYPTTNLFSIIIQAGINSPPDLYVGTGISHAIQVFPFGPTYFFNLSSTTGSGNHLSYSIQYYYWRPTDTLYHKLVPL